MSHPRLIKPFLFAALAVASACGRAADNRSTQATAGAAAAPSPQNQAVETETAQEAPMAGAILATGTILVPENRIAAIGPVHEGRIVHLYAGQGARVRRGQKLADLESADIDEAKSEYLKAAADYDNARKTSQAEVKLAQATFDRTKLLYEKTIAAQKTFQSAEHDLEVAKAAAESSTTSTKAALSAARRKLLILGMTASEIDRLRGDQDLGALFSLTSPIDGVVVERTATIGATVGADASVFKIIDISSVWIDANVFEKDLNRVKLGQGAKVSVPAFPDAVFSGKVIFISSVVDPDTRTLKVRTEVPNKDGKLKPDMFANIQIITDVDRSVISVPQSAVLNDGAQSIVFVANTGGYERRVVALGIVSGDRVEIREGVKAGEKVVVKGNYLLLEQSKAAK
ncbi:MAG TPA: efflux RND transporter periplasmic adaptor subunit [Blastocatellia bacterium]|nr:efflux RND transporter periplasmic adaptor subunit [Blastocatellia bacterium]